LKKLFAIASLVFVLTAVSFAGVTISSPANGASTNSPLHIKASASPWDTSAIKSMQVYIDGGLVYNRSGSSVDSYFNVGSGWHQVVVKAWNSAGANSSKTVSVKGSGAGIIVNSPAQDSTVSGSTRIYAKGYSSSGISGMKVYDNGDEIGSSSGSLLDKTVSLSSGSHWLVVQAWSGGGTVYKFPLSVNVASGSGSGGSVTSPSTGSSTQVSIPSSASKKTEIDEMTGWEHCDRCAGAGGDGPDTLYSMTQWWNTPSIDGDSINFWLGGSTPYANAIWWKQLGAQSWAKHFVYDLKFFYKNSSAVQALEFDANQSVNGLKYIFGTECNIRGGKGWRVWDTKNKYWVTTGKSCSPKTNEWNHLTWEFERVGNQIHFIAVTLNGYRQTINRYYYAKSSSVNELNVAFQMDGNSDQTDYSVWVDKITLYYW
jgi:Bacterial Ig domain